MISAGRYMAPIERQLMLHPVVGLVWPGRCVRRTVEFNTYQFS